MKLQNKIALITGGARGIGAATAEKFASEGASIILADLNEEDVQKTAEELKAKGYQAEGRAVNVTNKDDVEALVQGVQSDYGQIDALVNNAGITSDAQLLKMTEEQWDQVIDVNLKGVFLVSQAAAQAMKAQEHGVILNASSVVGEYGNFGQTNYAATKFGVNGMTKTWAKELGRYNIRVNSVAPGFILTPMTEEMPEKVLNMMKEKSVLNDLGRPEDIANAYCFLASDEARFITGTVLNVDGGVVM
ncbi:3-oxoacyl-[acyl-carrier-protein] reductase [Salsuginibacillus halophilus]|uniref:3-oxoacyl-[acyl-carrier-protein] reductase n=1 Tax=Salsuginibacillus halophilus TaxID=517424 RepID=A0A2P8HYS6_9BACI|nr:3-oxoacyl-[acyl-carrier-protein] reductase [Salsuginibacillus halophilus]PSL51367.1 3-oxoacyl-[acyl-carrier-protein] reductase [Salsuginibacillus halophilus]